MRGYLAGIEGIEGAVKSTVAKRVAAALKSLGYDVLVAQEPGTSEVGQRLRQLVKDPSLTIQPEASLHIFMAARIQLILDVILPALAQGKVVILDRYYLSTIAYQGFGEGMDVASVTRICLEAVRDAIPDRLFLLDISIETMRQRLTTRGAETDRYEQMDIAFHERVRRGYRTQASQPGCKIQVIEGEDSEDVVARRVTHAILTDLIARAS